jgi:cytochrome P450
MDPPRHDALRNLVSRAFTGRRADVWSRASARSRAA